MMSDREQISGISAEKAVISPEFSKASDIEKETAPVGPIGLIALKGTENLAAIINSFLVEWRRERGLQERQSLLFAGYEKDSYILNAETVRFGSGEGKGIVYDVSRGEDLYFLVDVTNYSISYKVGGIRNHYSPDDHYQDLKRLISAAAGKARRMTVIMPFLYEGRQHNRSSERESLDCAQMLKELVGMGVTNIITFDANDPRVQNAIPLHSFDTFSPTYQYIKALCRNYSDIDFDSEHLTVVSPDEGGMRRAIYFANVLGVDMGMFYVRKDYSQMINGRNPIIAHEFLGPDVAGRDVIIVDDMISSGDTVLDVALHLKERNARRVFACVTFGLFTNGLHEFDEAYRNGIIDKIFTTNLIYQSPELLAREWYANVNMGKYIALMIDLLNHDYSISKLLNPTERINRLLTDYRRKRNDKVQE